LGDLLGEIEEDFTKILDFKILNDQILNDISKTKAEDVKLQEENVDLRILQSVESSTKETRKERIQNTQDLRLTSVHKQI
jgi:hypothetical protein